MPDFNLIEHHPQRVLDAFRRGEFVDYPGRIRPWATPTSSWRGSPRQDPSAHQKRHPPALSLPPLSELQGFSH